jgi:hypothetical protein
MTLTLNSRSDLVEPAARLLATAIDIGDGGTAEQRRVLELCRHPLTDAQVARVDAFAAAIGEPDDTGLELARDLVEKSRAEAAQHFFVAWAASMTKLSEAVLLERFEQIGAVDPELAMNDSEEHWMVFLTSMAAYEVGISSGTSDFEAKEGILTRDGSTELLFEGFERGSNCSGDFSTADHLSMVHLPISTIREMYSVPAPSTPFPPFID